MPVLHKVEQSFIFVHIFNLFMENHDYENLYAIPKRFRMIENLHIVFWLIKDLCWCLVYKPLGIAMIFPTFLVSIFLFWQNRKIPSERYHNLAVVLWISANSFWMVSEFFEFDNTIIFMTLTGKNVAIIPFVTGIFTLLVYYLFIAPKERRHNT